MRRLGALNLINCSVSDTLLRVFGRGYCLRGRGLGMVGPCAPRVSTRTFTRIYP